MEGSRGITVAIFVVLALLASVSLVSAQGSATRPLWQTLSGKAPVTIAHGGFSGIFSSPSFGAYSSALITGSTDVILWCDVQLTKDAVGICFPDLKLDNNPDIATVYSNKKSYFVNGVSTKGYFSIDYTLKDLSNVICKYRP